MKNVKIFYVLLAISGMEVLVYNMSKPVLSELIGMESLVLLLMCNALLAPIGMAHTAILFRNVLSVLISVVVNAYFFHKSVFPTTNGTAPTV